MQIVSSPFSTYGALMTVSEMRRNETYIPLLMKSISQIVTSYFAGDFRFVDFDIVLLNEIMTCCDAEGVEYPEKLTMSFMFVLDENDVPLTMKSSPESINDCLDVVMRFLVDSLNRSSDTVKSTLLWEHERSSSGLTLIIILSIIGIAVIAITSFGLFFKWSGNFIRINSRTGDSGLDVMAVVSVVTPPIGLLLEVIGCTWIWFNYRQLGFPLVTYQTGLAAVFIVFGILSLLILCFSSYMNILRSKYPANLIDLQFSTETLTYCLTLCLIQLPTNFVAYFYLAKFKAPGQFMPASLVVKPIFMLIIWINFISTTTGS